MPPHVVAHIALMALGIVVFATAVVFARLKRRAWVARHRMTAVAGVVLGIAGAATMAVAKQLNGWPHLVSSHSRVGVTALALALAAPFLGTLFLRGRAKLRQPHRIVGAAAVALATVAAALKIVAMS